MSFKKRPSRNQPWPRKITSGKKEKRKVERGRNEGKIWLKIAQIKIRSERKREKIRAK